MSSTRTEKDSMGTMEVPSDALYGASTQRAVLNFPISGHGFGREFIRALGLIKWACAEANLELGRLTEDRVTLIARAAQEVIEGKHDAHFPVDIYQTGSGTSTNMNINEVISNRCCQLAGKPIGSKEPVHPNDHVNMGQSSNDIIPTAIHVAVGERIRKYLMPALEGLHAALEKKTLEFWDVIKIGRTHLMDATPVRLGQEFGGYAKQIEYANSAPATPSPPSRNSRSAAPRSAPDSTAIPTSPASSCAISGTRPASPFAKLATTSRRRPPRMASCKPAANSRPSPSPSSKSPTTSAGSAVGPAAASVRSSSPRLSLAVPSCPAR